MSSIIYTPKDIYEQDFKKVMRGYDPREVDEFLDDVIKDYETYIKEIQKLKQEIASLKSTEGLSTKPSYDGTVSPLSQSKQVGIGTIPQSRSEVNQSDFKEYTPPVSATNLDILKRISRLEKEVFGKQIVE